MIPVQASERGVRKSADDIEVRALQIGISPSRIDPISPLATLAGASIMADAAASVRGVNLSRRQRKALRAEANRFASGRLSLFGVVGNRGTVTM